ncbi:LysE family translocator [Solimonas marina]|uniref:LysE family transporter n=1 Tax=Solimonas marina TaxID=2714601 RepID=A0A969WBB9_9GAMM|nr:LysE family transporter [Solimonas marina]NKF23832.1 LysE family transporter [Solimonas marina]
MAASGLAVFGAVAAAHALGVASPGPDFAIVVRQSLARGRAAGLWTAAGIGSGIFFHVAYGLFGLAWLTRTFPWALSIIALAGAAFLIWMGSKALRAPPAAASDDGEPIPVPTTAGSAWRDYTAGLGTNVLNPKATLFFVALFTAVVSGPIATWLMVVLALWLPLTTFAWFATLAMLLSHAGLRRALRRHAQRIDQAMGVILVALGLFVIVRTTAAWFYR